MLSFIIWKLNPDLRPYLGRDNFIYIYYFYILVKLRNIYRKLGVIALLSANQGVRYVFDELTSKERKLFICKLYKSVWEKTQTKVQSCDKCLEWFLRSQSHDKEKHI